MVCSLVLRAALAQEPWPTKVPVLTPDPILGNEQVWEYWTYNEAFAKRFDGFHPDLADKNLSAGVYAIVFRTYKRRTYADLDLYHCQYDIYFDETVRIPLSSREVPFSNPPGVSSSFHGLRPARDEDAARLSRAGAEKYQPRNAPVILSDGKVEGRYAWFSAHYFAGLVEGISMVTLRTDYECRSIAPTRPGSHLWISLFGEMAFNQGSEKDARPWRLSNQFQNWTHSGTFDPPPQEDATRKGFIRLPQKLQANVLQKVALIKSMNQCIIWRTGIERRKESRETDADVLSACEGIQNRGEVRKFSWNRNIFIGRPHQGF
jgi:hypothetical protein